VASKRNLLGLSLTASAGWVDAIGFLQLPGFYVSFMSGNTTQLGVAIAQQAFGPAIFAASLIALFLAGSLFAGLAAGLPDRLALLVILGVEAVLLGVALALAVGWHGRGAMLALPVAMGVQNGAIRQLRPGATTYVTGTLSHFGHELGRRLAGADDAVWLPQALTWLSFALGAAAGALGATRFGLFALSVPLGIVVICALASRTFGTLETQTE
jgi:uncharacterized membrane protein YoaK (UPF0700 family)